jgi:hypothetical protein
MTAEGGGRVTDVGHSRRVYRNARPCTVHGDGGEWPGLLLAWQRTDRGWRGYLEYVKGVGLRHLGWFDAEHLAPA